MNKNRKIKLLAMSVAVFGCQAMALAEESTMDKAQTGVNKATDSVKETYRDAKDKACPLVDGKAQCLGKKIVHKTETLKDKVDTKATEVKNKVD